MKKLLVGIMALALLSGVAKADWDPGDGYKMHSPQLPDPYGWDVWVEHWSSSSYYELGDDWQCTETGPVEDIHIWGSFWADLGFVQYFKISIYSNAVGPPSHPDTLLWQRHFDTFDDRLYGDASNQGWMIAHPGQFAYYPENHMNSYQYNITNIVSPFMQQQGEIYWLVISAKAAGGDVSFGWKTAIEQSFDNAVVRYIPTHPIDWTPLVGPQGEPLDFAFVINGEPGAIPTLTEWGLITLVLLLMAVGVVTIVRKRRMVRAR